MVKQKFFILRIISITKGIIILIILTMYRYKPIDRHLVVENIGVSSYFSEKEIHQAEKKVIKTINYFNRGLNDDGFDGYVKLHKINFDEYNLVNKGLTDDEKIIIETIMSDNAGKIKWSWIFKKTIFGWKIENYGAA